VTASEPVSRFTFHWLEVDCPTCPAKAGQKCRNTANPRKKSSAVHSERHTAATEARQCVFRCGRPVENNDKHDDPHDPLGAIATPDGRSWAHRGCAADNEHEQRRDGRIG